jgi:MoxR-like ATPase
MTNWVENNADPQLSIFWLSGMAGTGKTAIARTFADKMNEDLTLGATFFVDRLDTPRRDPARIVQTLAFDLAQIDPGLPAQISLVFRDIPNIKSMPLMTQVQRLIKKPLTTVPSLMGSISSLHWSQVYPSCASSYS